MKSRLGLWSIGVTRVIKSYINHVDRNVMSSISASKYMEMSLVHLRRIPINNKMYARTPMIAAEL